MSKMGKFDYKGLKDLQKELERLQKETDAFVESCAKELAARLLAKVIKRTPVGDYSHEIIVTAKRDGKKHKKGDQYTKKVNYGGKKGGTLRRGWTAQKSGLGSESLKTNKAKQYADSLEISHSGNMYVVEIINPVEYASYVEYGHRTANHKGWVPGRFMLKVSEQELREIAPAVLENRIKKFLKGAMK